MYTRVSSLSLSLSLCLVCAIFIFASLGRRPGAELNISGSLARFNLFRVRARAYNNKILTGRLCSPHFPPRAVPL